MLTSEKTSPKEKYEVSGNDIILHEKDLILGETLDCGQAFRWYKTAENTYSGYYLDTPLEISGSDGVFTLKNTTEDDFLNIWYDYFDLGTDYSELKARYSADPTLASACEYSRGMRLLRQNPWETLVSYIFSSNNTITNIKKIIARLFEHYAHFPTAEELACESEESLAYLRSGFRAKYILDAAERVASGEISLKAVKAMPYPEAKTELMKIKGVGPKVADCVLLYGLHFVDAFPIDVWIKRALENFYPQGLPECVRGTEGIAQLYLFNYIRNL